MSIFNERLTKLTEISTLYTRNINQDLKIILETLDKFAEEYQNGRGRAREKGAKDKNLLTTLQSINEDEDVTTTAPEPVQTSRRSSVKSNDNCSSNNSNEEKTQRLSNKRSKNEVDGLSSPEQDKRHKRNASVKAQSIITKQVNVNLTQKMRREDASDKSQSRSRRRKDDNKENSEPVPNIQIKQEKISLPPEPMDTASLPIDTEIKREVNEDEITMPPPTAPVPKPRKAAKDRATQDDNEEETTSRRRTTRTRKQTDTMPPPAAAPRSTRASSRAARPGPEPEVTPPAPHSPPDLKPQIPEVRPKRTRTRKKVSEVDTDSEKQATQTAQADGTASPADKRPKRTRRGQKANKEEAPKPDPVVSPKEDLSQPENAPSPILPQKKTNHNKEAIKIKVDSDTEKDITNKTNQLQINGIKSKIVLQSSEEDVECEVMDETHVLSKSNDAVVPNDMDKTIVLPNGIYEHAPVTPKKINVNMNTTVVLEKYDRETMVIEKQTAIMDATVVIDKDPQVPNITEDNSILTDDNSDVQEALTPLKEDIPKAQPTSAVKEKVQQFEELATRVTRTKTRAMAKKEEGDDNQTPPDKILKHVLSAETLSKMNNLIFNGKTTQVSSSATKPRTNIITSVKSFIPSSTSKVSAINKAKEKEAAEESMKKEKEDARKKKEAMLEAKREQQKKKREEKMAAAAAVRSAAERERRAALEAADRERREKQAHADLGRQERLREAERKKQELARKVAETEERRRAEEHARQQRLAEEQKRADAVRRKQIEEAEAMKKEAAIMAKEIEKRQKEYIEKQKIKQRLESDKFHTPRKTPGTPGHHHEQYTMEPVYMADGFQYLNSDEEAEPAERPIPMWCTSKVRRPALARQAQLPPPLVDRLFSVRSHSPDLRDIFPAIDRARLKRTSSAVWSTPPHRLPAVSE
ncbi:inner centromere protein [Achroia grisella]|uniref:inner centromere protein n=1 Tax=Achroia grisella TaxID=688607 RepID=UPI0027D24502|nr:inner centromere protein [Achroia grisella]